MRCAGSFVSIVLLAAASLASADSIAGDLPFLHPTDDRRAGPDWWSLQPIRRPAVPGVHDTGWCSNSIDAFVLSKMEARNMFPAPEAEKRTLVRRLTFDLIGLPPTPGEIDGFVNDNDPKAYGKMVERLLASPQYGEHWARHWLDIVRFGESEGFEHNRPRPNAWRYRDWVIAAFNADLPYDLFVRDQIAGDVRAPNDPMAVTATGYLTCGSYDSLGLTKGTEAMIELTRLDHQEDQVGNFAQTFLGLTVNCARCHDHKFDPISQKEFYQLAAALAGVGEGERETLTDANDSAVRSERESLGKKIAEVHERMKSLDGAIRQRLGEGAHARAERGTGPARSVGYSQVLAEMPPTDRMAYDPLLLQVSQYEMRDRLLKGGPGQAVISRRPPIARVLIHGDFRRPGEVVAAGGLAAVAGLSADFSLSPDAPEGKRRAALANWVVDPRNPLAARVIANRLWHYHFGAGMIRTPNDLGFNGGRPSHPQLLDFLAVELVDHGWSLKYVQRLIVMSSTYRQASSTGPAALTDAENRLLWHKAPMRLEAEELRDAMLAVSGELNPQMGGRGYADDEHSFMDDDDFYSPREVAGPEFDRRSIYRTWNRAGVNPFLETMDCPDPSVATAARSATTTPLQALTLLNGALAVRLSGAFATRVEREAGADAEKQIERAYRLALGRSARGEEITSAKKFLSAYGLRQFCLVLYNSSEFLYVD